MGRAVDANARRAECEVEARTLSVVCCFRCHCPWVTVQWGPGASGRRSQSQQCLRGSESRQGESTLKRQEERWAS